MTLAVVALGLTACGDEDEPTQSASPTPTPTASASASPSAPSPSASASPSGPATAAADVPAAAKARTEAGAIAFLKFYIDLSNRALLDPQNAPNLFDYADKDCIACKKTQDLFSEYAKGGWTVKKSGIRVDNPALATDVTAPKVIVNFTFVEAEQPLYQKGKKTNSKIPAASAKKAAALKWVNQGWQMFDLEDL
ncbi:DUF6318 family protein [Knoellia sp. CPCC 206450]|uniref:DUF6318 family protein n=1 Tax=Knoellia tibetensis TaxID=3404798 RepID=UPI003B4368EA